MRLLSQLNYAHLRFLNWCSNESDTKTVFLTVPESVICIRDFNVYRALQSVWPKKQRKQAYVDEAIYVGDTPEDRARRPILIRHHLGAFWIISDLIIAISRLEVSLRHNNCDSSTEGVRRWSQIILV